MTKPRFPMQRVLGSRMWAKQFAISIRQNCSTQKSRNEAIKAFLEIYLIANPTFNEKEFRAVANGTVGDNMLDDYFAKLKEKYALE